MIKAVPPVMSVDQPVIERTTLMLRRDDCPTRGTVTVGPYELEYLAPRAFASTLELLYLDRIYDAAPVAAGQAIIDGGGWLGLSVIRFRELFPTAPITVFEPDPDVFELLCRNLERNRIADVTPVCAALAGADGTHAFSATGADNGSLVANVWHSQPRLVPTSRLSTYLTGSVGLLKLNIEGAEANVIAEARFGLSGVDQVLIEYHGFSELPQTLHEILTALHEAGHTYIISQFNERNRSCVPPLRLPDNYRYFLLIYARRLRAQPPSA